MERRQPRLQEPTKEQLIKKVCEHKNLSPGSIILMHTGTKCTKQALKQIIKNIKAKGYEFVPVSRLIYRRDTVLIQQGNR